MQINEFINNLQMKFKEFSVDDTIIKKDDTGSSLIIPITDEEVPSYKLAVSFIEDGYLSIYTAFCHNAVLKKELGSILTTLNEFNQQSFVKFTLDKKYIKVSYNIPEVDQDDVEKIVRIISIIPNIIYDFYQDLKQYLQKK